jgi:hypothetical protein
MNLATRPAWPNAAAPASPLTKTKIVGDDVIDLTFHTVEIGFRATGSGRSLKGQPERVGLKK